MKTPTPETDAEFDRLRFVVDPNEFNCERQRDAVVFGMAEFSRKLERERDEALRVVSEQHAQIIGCYAIEDELRNERDHLRKVCDELANATRAEFGELNWRLDEYNQLPHVAKLHLPSGILRNTNS